jgi:hypothetical protein
LVAGIAGPDRKGDVTEESLIDALAAAAAITVVTPFCFLISVFGLAAIGPFSVWWAVVISPVLAVLAVSAKHNFTRRRRIRLSAAALLAVTASVAVLQTLEIRLLYTDSIELAYVGAVLATLFGASLLAAVVRTR